MMHDGSFTGSPNVADRTGWRRPLASLCVGIWSISIMDPLADLRKGIYYLTYHSQVVYFGPVPLHVGWVYHGREWLREYYERLEPDDCR